MDWINLAENRANESETDTSFTLYVCVYVCRCVCVCVCVYLPLKCEISYFVEELVFFTIRQKDW